MPGDGPLSNARVAADKRERQTRKRTASRSFIPYDDDLWRGASYRPGFGASYRPGRRIISTGVKVVQAPTPLPAP